MPELDLRTAENPTVSHYFTLYRNNDRAMQCPAPGRDGTFFVSQAQGVVPENICVTENDATVPEHKRLRQMRLLKAGHGTTISAVYIKAVPWILVHAWGGLKLVKFRDGDVRSNGTNIRDYPGSFGYGYVDHENHTICLRKGNAFWLYRLQANGMPGKQIGAASKDLVGPGPNQGYFTIRWNKRNYLMTCWDFGGPTAKPTVVVGSLDSGKKLYSINVRASFPSWAGRREPESGFSLLTDTPWGKIPVAHIGASVTKDGVKMAIAIAMPVPLPDVAVTQTLPVAPPPDDPIVEEAPV